MHSFHIKIKSRAYSHDIIYIICTELIFRRFHFIIINIILNISCYFSYHIHISFWWIKFLMDNL